jgi:hypothetical protein
VVKDVLNLAADYIDQGWTKGVSARTKDGKVTFASSDSAVSWCAIGAISRAANEINPEYFRSAYTQVTSRLPVPVGSSLSSFNDLIAADAFEVSNFLRKAAEDVEN